jgi:hypothetical protein
MRKPSCLISCTQPGPDGTRSAGDGRQGRMKREGEARNAMPAVVSSARARVELVQGVQHAHSIDRWDDAAGLQPLERPPISQGDLRGRRQTLARCQDHPAQRCPHHREDLTGGAPQKRGATQGKVAPSRDQKSSRGDSFPTANHSRPILSQIWVFRRLGRLPAQEPDAIAASAAS